MSDAALLDRLRDDIMNFDFEDIEEACLHALEAGTPIAEIVDAMQEGMKTVEMRYQREEYYLPELVMAGETMNEALAVLRPHMGKEVQKGIVVVGTIRGDLHDVGKNLLGNLLEGAGFSVYDLGVDVKAGDFIQAVKERQAGVICMSALISTSLREMPAVIKCLEQESFKRQIKVLVGGGAVSRGFAERIGADAYASDALEGVAIVKRWLA
ncbi:MAG: cobalamin-dependent protein [Candidatus Hydrothermarchaeales archaeon]